MLSLFLLLDWFKEGIFWMIAMIKLYILGTTTIEKENDEKGHSFLTGPKRLALFAYLLMAQPSGYHRRDSLIALFWPEMGQKSARNALSNLIYHIREALGKDIILNRGAEEIAINHDALWCDALVFKKAYKNEAYQKALDLYKGDILQGLHLRNASNDFQDWLDQQRDDYRKNAAEAAMRLAGEMEQTENNLYAKRLALKAARLLPLNQDYQQQTIGLLVRTGFKDEALKCYQQYEEQLRSELGVPVPEKLQKLIQSLKEQKSEPTVFTDKSQDSAEGSISPKTTSDKLQNNSGGLPFKNRSPGNRTSLVWGSVSVAAIFMIAFLGWYFWPDISNPERPILPESKSSSVAVLPFTYINAPDSTDYFSIGITEEILTKLARAGGLSIISRTSVMQYKGSQKSIREIAQELGVGAIVEGSVMTYGDQVRISVKLINAESDHNMWANSYDRKLQNILSVQNEVATHIADALQAELLPESEPNSLSQDDVNEEAYHQYLRGKHLLDLNEPATVIEAADFFEKSVATDSTFAPAHSDLSLARFRSGLLSRFDEDVTGIEGIPLKEATQLALVAANRALALDSTVVGAHLSLAQIFELVDKDWEQSERFYKRALTLNPNNSETLRLYGWHLLRTGKIDQALDLMLKAVKVDPLSWATHHSLGYAYYCSRNYTAAIRQLETSVNLGSRYPNTKKYLSTARMKYSRQLFSEGRDQEARTLIENASELLNEMWGSDTGWKKTIIFAAMGEKEQTLEQLKNDTLPFPPRFYANLMIGNTEEVLDMVEQNMNFQQRVYMDPIFDSIRYDERYKAMVEKKLNHPITIR